MKATVSRFCPTVHSVTSHWQLDLAMRVFITWKLINVFPESYITSIPLSDSPQSYSHTDLTNRIKSMNTVLICSNSIPHGLVVGKGPKSTGDLTQSVLKTRLCIKLHRTCSFFHCSRKDGGRVQVVSSMLFH